MSAIELIYSRLKIREHRHTFRSPNWHRNKKGNNHSNGNYVLFQIYNFSKNISLGVVFIHKLYQTIWNFIYEHLFLHHIWLCLEILPKDIKREVSWSNSLKFRAFNVKFCINSCRTNCNSYSLKQNSNTTRRNEMFL